MASAFGLAEADFLSEFRRLRNLLERSAAGFSLGSGALVSFTLLSDLACDYLLRLPIDFITFLIFTYSNLGVKQRTLMA